MSKDEQIHQLSLRLDEARKIIRELTGEDVGEPIQRTPARIAHLTGINQILRENLVLLEHLFISDPDGNILVNDRGEILSVNPQVENLFGYSSGELIGEKVEKLIPQRYQKIHRLERGKYMQHPHTRTMGAGLDLFGCRKDGSEFPVDVTLSPMQMKQGLVVLAVVRDITDRKRMEAELAEVQHRLLDSVEAERKRLAQILHDGPVQDMYGIDYQLHSLMQTEDDQQQRVGLAEVNRAIEHTVQVLRDLCSDLRPQSLAKFGLEKAIRSYAEQFQEKYPHLMIELDLDKDQTLLPETVRIALYRNCQQLLINVARHAQATRVVIRLILEPEKVILDISDNGRGFKASSRWVDLAREGHLGLVGCSERVKALGGNLEIKSSPGQGTTVRSIIPVTINNSEE